LELDRYLYRDGRDPYDCLHLPVTVLDAHGRFVSGLTRDDFLIREDMAFCRSGRRGLSAVGPTISLPRSRRVPAFGRQGRRVSGRSAPCSHTVS
jgi:hypothetical protein